MNKKNYDDHSTDAQIYLLKILERNFERSKLNRNRKRVSGKPRKQIKEKFEPIGLFIFGDLPKTCKECPLLYTDQGWGFDFCVFQQWSGEEITLDYYDKLDKKGERPDWCPLAKDLATFSARMFGKLKIDEVIERKKK